MKVLHSEIAKRLKLKYLPVAVLFTNEKPEGALEFAEGRWGCVSSMLTAAAKGRQAVFSRTTFGCPGGGMGLGFSNQYSDSMVYLLSVGKEGAFEGQALKKTPELVKDSLEPYTKINTISEQYVVFKPLTDVDVTKEEPKVVVFYANPDQLSALVMLVNYGRFGNDNVVAPFAAGCQSTCILPWCEATQEHPRAVIGMMDIGARHVIDADLLSFSVPYAMFWEMEDNIPGSFLEKQEWNKLAERI